ncbi:hypothetical protein EHT87_15020 [Larkinella knui]|uniref:GLPGLI family protein n=2 Tax=Larkinella knui TaxID=2025310 RepID=A0A3P1CJP8_9BACT|nr:hypothetical protein EHT87_15020 [Larkinella knui]
MRLLMKSLLLALFCLQSVFGQEQSDSLFVFVGQKIKVDKFEPKVVKGQIPFNEAFKAKYKVVQQVYGSYQKNTIDFEAYDHMGTPAFSKFDNVLLFVSNHNEKWFHEKYQYFDVYKTKEGKWASCGDPYKFDDYHRKSLKAVKLEFAEPVSFDVSYLNVEHIKKWYPEPYFTIRNNRAYCLMGAYVDELFQVKKEGVLKARGIFK